MNRLLASLRSTLGLFVLSAVLCAGVILGSIVHVLQVQGKFRTAHNRLLQDHAKIFTQLDDQEFLFVFGEKISLLASSGKLGHVDRLLWVDTLTEIGRELSIEDYQFEMSPANVSDINRSQIHQVEIAITGSLLHDGVIEDFFSLLAQIAPGGYSIDALEVERSELQHADSLGPLSMSTVISWYSIVPDKNSEKPIGITNIVTVFAHTPEKV